MMRNAIAIVAMIQTGLVFTSAAGCGKGEQEGIEAAKREQEAELKAAAAQQLPTDSKRIKPPIPQDTKIPCDQLIDLAGFTTALGEKDPLTFKDLTASNHDASASCSLVRGGKRLTPAEQATLLKKERRLGVMAGDEICNVTAFCSLLEDEAHFEEHCKQMKFQDDDSIGSYACKQVVAQGADDVYSFKFLDPDTRCVIAVRGGPSLVDNQIITSCAKAARDLIGPNNIKPGGGSVNPPPAAPGSGAASGATK
jgi:hypothetical protein